MSRTDKIFISYRRDDEPFAARGLYNRLANHFGAENVFFDVDSIPIGVDFVKYLNNEVRKCAAFISIIGDQWLDARDSQGNRRLESDEDFVRIEIEAALELGLLVVPVLINGAEMPRSAELPESVRPITRRNALSVSHARFIADADGMVRLLNEALQRRANEIAERERIAAERAEQERKAEKARKADEALRIEDARKARAARKERRAKANLEAEVKVEAEAEAWEKEKRRLHHDQKRERERKRKYRNYPNA